tara:strand:- start:413 stop:889 length:477 start_codon:yes stop_codon:yes gene_type:complete
MKTYHHIDASVFLELFMKLNRVGSQARECREYLYYKLNKKNYNPKLSIFALGEIVKTVSMMEIGKKSDIEQRRLGVFADLLKLINDKNIDYWSPQFGCMEKAIEVNNENYYKPADTLHVSCASQDPLCDTFVTIDKELLDSSTLEKKLKIKIKHPSVL